MGFLLFLGLTAPWLFGYLGKKMIQRSRKSGSRILGGLGVLVIFLSILAFGAAIVILDNHKAIFGP